MEKMWLLIVAGMVACPGCTTLLLKEYTLRQTESSGDGRDTMVLRCLAIVAANPDALPPFALYSSGIATVTDSVTLNLISTWAPFKYVLDNLGMTAAMYPKGQWTIDPTTEYQQLEAMHAACLWALFGPEEAWKAYPTGILGDSQEYLDGKPHFGVENRLWRTQPGWVHSGRLEDVPACARYKMHKGTTWIWVMPQDSESFAQFSLVFQDIATLDPTIIASPPLLVQLTALQITNLPDVTAEEGKPKQLTISATEQQQRAVKKEYKETIEKAIQEGMRTGKVNLTRAQWMAYTEPWPGTRNPAGEPPNAPSPASTSLSVRYSKPLQLPLIPLIAPPSPPPSPR